MSDNTLMPVVAAKALKDSEVAIVRVIQNINIVRIAHNVEVDTLGMNTGMGISRARNIFELLRFVKPLTFEELHCTVDVLNAICGTAYTLHDYETRKFSSDGKILPIQ